MICHNCLKEIFESRGYCTSCHDIALDEVEKEAKIPVWHTVNEIPIKGGWYIIDNPEKWNNPYLGYFNINTKRWNKAKGLIYWTELPERMK